MTDSVFKCVGDSGGCQTKPLQQRERSGGVERDVAERAALQATKGCKDGCKPAVKIKLPR